MAFIKLKVKKYLPNQQIDIVYLNCLQMFGNSALNMFTQASKQNKVQIPAVNPTQTKPVEDKTTSGNKQSVDNFAQKQKTPKSNPFVNKEPASQPLQNIFTKQRGNLFASNKEQPNIFSNPAPKNELLVNKQTTNLFDKSDNSQKQNLFANSSTSLFGPKVELSSQNIFGTKTSETNSKNDQNLTNKAEVAGKHNVFSLSSNQSNITALQKSIFGTEQKNNFGVKPSPQSNLLFGAKNQTQKPNIFAAQESKTPYPLFGSPPITPGFLNLNKPEKQPQNRNQAKKKDEPKRQEQNAKKQQPLPFKSTPNPFINKEPQQKNIPKPTFFQIPEPQRQKNEPLQQSIKQENIPPILAEKKQQILSILNQIQKKGENIELESKLQQITQNELQNIQIQKENSQQQKKLLEQQLSKANELLEQRKDEVEKLKKQYFDQNCFKSLLNRFNNQSSDEFQDEENAINTQMTNLVRQVSQYFLNQNQQVNPEAQLRNIFKNIQKQRQNQHKLTSQQQYLNKQNIQTLKKAKGVKELKESTDQFVGKRKQSWISKSKEQVENNDDQYIYLRKLKASNKAQIDKLIKTRGSLAIEKKVMSRITQGRTSMIMKSIIME